MGLPGGFSDYPMYLTCLWYEFHVHASRRVMASLPDRIGHLTCSALDSSWLCIQRRPCFDAPVCPPRRWHRSCLRYDAERPIQPDCSGRKDSSPKIFQKKNRALVVPLFGSENTLQAPSCSGYTYNGNAHLGSQPHAPCSSALAAPSLRRSKGP